MFCNMCGTNIPDGADFCPNCGADLRQFKQAATQPAEEPAPQETAEDIAQKAAQEAAQKAAEETANAEPQQISAESTTPMMDIPIADAPEDEIDPESGTTVLTADMSGPLTASEAPQGFADTASTADPFTSASTDSFASAPVEEPVAAPAPAEEPAAEEPVKEEVHQHQPQAPEGKVVTPAPVTGSSILSDESVAPVTPTVQAQPLPQAQPANQSFNQVNQGGFNANAQQNAQFNQNPYMPAGGQGITVINQMGGGDVPEEYKPISPWGYLGYTILFGIPLVGLILMFVWGFGATTNKNLKNYARFYLITIAITVALYILILIISAITGAAIIGGLSDY